MHILAKWLHALNQIIFLFYLFECWFILMAYHNFIMFTDYFVIDLLMLPHLLFRFGKIKRIGFLSEEIQKVISFFKPLKDSL